MPAVIVLGTQWGDEGKGKATDQIGQQTDVVVKYNGGNNAGHTVVIDGEKDALHLLPAAPSPPPPMAIFYSLMMLVIGIHLAQGIWNVINDLGGTGPRLRKIWLGIGLLISLAIVIGNGALPILILTGVIS